MEKDFLYNSRRQLVAKRNDLVQNARLPLTKIQNEVIQYMVSKVKPTDKPGTEYTFKCSEFYALMGYTSTSYTDIKAMLQSIQKISWWVDGQNGEDDKLLQWFNIAHVNRSKETVTVTFHTDIEPYIFQLVEQKALFSSYPFQYISMMKSFYSQKLYELLNTHKHDKPKPGKKYPEWTYEIGTGSKNDLFIRIAQAAPGLDQRFRMGRKNKAILISKYDGYAPGEPIIPKSWKNFAVFKRDVLEPAINEINRYTDMIVRYEPLKTDLAGNKYRRYTSIRFSWILKSEGQIEETEKKIDDEYSRIEDESKKSHLQDTMNHLQEEQDQFEKAREKKKEIKKANDLEEELCRRAENSNYQAATSTFGQDFTDDQLKFLFSASLRHLPPGTIDVRNRDLWLTDYIAHYKDIVDATPEDTKTTPYKRLLNMLKNDYENVGPVYAEMYKKQDVYEDQPVMPFSEKRLNVDTNKEDPLQKAMKYLEKMEMTCDCEVKRYGKI